MTGAKGKKRSGGGGKPKSGGGEPTEQEMVIFHGLLRAQNAAAVKAHGEFSTSQDKVKFYQDIISICRKSSAAKESDTKKPDSTASNDKPKSKISSSTPLKNSSSDSKKKQTRSSVDITVEVKEPAIVPKTNAKSECKFFVNQGSCRKGEKCRFLHPDGILNDGRWTHQSSTVKNDAHSNVTNGNGGLDKELKSTDVSSSLLKEYEVTSESVLENIRDTMPRTNSVDNAMGLMEMDVKYLEENLDMRLENDSESPSIDEDRGKSDDQEYSQLFRDLMAGRIGGNEEHAVNTSEMTWMSLNNTEQVENIQSAVSTTPLLESSSLSISPTKESSSVNKLQDFSSIVPSVTNSSVNGGYDTFGQSSNSSRLQVGSAGESPQKINSHNETFFSEVISDVIDVASSNFPPSNQSPHSQRGIISPPSHHRTEGDINPREMLSAQRQDQQQDVFDFAQDGRENPQGQHEHSRGLQAGQELTNNSGSPRHVPPGNHDSSPMTYPPNFPRGYPNPPPSGQYHQHLPPNLENQPRNVGAPYNTNAPPPGPGGNSYGYPYSGPPPPFPPPPHHMYGMVPPGMYPPHGGMMPLPGPSPQQLHQMQHEHFVRQQQIQHFNQQQQLHLQHQRQQQQQHEQQQQQRYRISEEQVHQTVGSGERNHESASMQSSMDRDVNEFNRGGEENQSNFVEKPKMKDFTTENFINLTSSSPHIDSATESSPENTKTSQIGEKSGPCEEEAVSIPQPNTNSSSTVSHSSDSVKSQKLLSFLKSNVKADLPSVNALKRESLEGSAKENIDEEKVVSLLEAASKKLENETPKESKKVEYYRTTKHQTGKVNIVKPTPGPLTLHGSRHSTQPGGHLSLSWELPLDSFKKSHDAHIVIALTRLGSMNNANNIVAKTLKMSKSSASHFVTGNISFHAPKAAGYYVFRIFDQFNDESKSQTLATSAVFSVELKGRDVTTNLAFILKAFSAAVKQSKADNGAINGLKNVFELMRTSGAVVNAEKPPQELLQNCVQLLLNMMFKQMEAFDILAELVRVEGEDDTSQNAAEMTTAWQNSRAAQKMHMTTYDCLVALRCNKIAMGMLTAEQRTGVGTVIGLYSPLLSRFFRSFDDLQKACIKEIGFEPSPLQPSFKSLCIQSSDKQLHQRSRAVLRDLTEAVTNVSSRLIPPASFTTEREDIRQRLQSVIRASGVVPSTCSLVLFGSSKNNFGAVGADLDMCLQYGPGEVLPVGEERSGVIERLGDVLSQEGMIDVQARSTARIPILLFKDCISGIDCDISFNNPLAICNTNLLATYSVIDERVRALAFAIKHWAKQREINSPQNGTLSSYGYILCLIHFLQTRNLIPDLQSLPPNWDPQRPVANPPPVHIEQHPVDGTRCNTYFYDIWGNENNIQKLKRYCSHNKQSLGELLMEFFRYFAYDFDYRREIVSIRRLNGNECVTKLSKMESSCWGSHERLSVEDPFEPWYDVAHVLKTTQMTYIRAEFLRAYTLMYNAAVNNSSSYGNSDRQDSLFDRLCSPPSEVPKFIVKQQQQAERRSRSNTITSES